MLTTNTGRALLLLTAIFNCSACSVPHYLKSEFKPEKRADGRVYASLSLEPENIEAPSLDLYKIHKGYAIKHNLDWNQDTGRKGDIVMSKSKEYDWFTGLQWRFEF